MLLIIINTEGTEIYLQREKEEKRFILQREKEVLEKVKVNIR